MRKYLLPVVLFLTNQVSLFGQGSPKAMLRDRLRIDSMQKLIPVKKDTAHINFLNKFSNQIIYSAYSNKQKVEWATPYVQLTFQEAKQIEYKIKNT